METDNHLHPRRALLGGAFVLGLCALNRVLTASDPLPAGGRIPLPAAGSASPHLAARPRPPASASASPSPGAAGSRHRAPRTVTYTLPPDRREIALSFDDGPSAEYTPGILEVLRRNGVRATFCVIGRNAVEHPDLLRAVTDAGHLIANHSWSHAQLTGLPEQEAREELSRTSDVIERTLGAPPVIARAPYGDWNDATLRICAELGMSPLGWSVDTDDWEMPGVARIVRTVMAEVRPGSVILSHDGGGNRVQSISALAAYLPRLLDAGYRPVLPTM
ncbi:polysaccharide deacetylase family protein [Streptomyces sp. NPDC059740]|uniref:polysaccharide deacetylase family protein n=1 Tax=Streptomyces sp. NPDC059740 TaxID=3346926 RepID=UPI00365CCAE7